MDKNTVIEILDPSEVPEEAEKLARKIRVSDLYAKSLRKLPPAVTDELKFVTKELFKNDPQLREYRRFDCAGTVLTYRFSIELISAGKSVGGDGEKHSAYIIVYDPVKTPRLAFDGTASEYE